MNCDQEGHQIFKQRQNIFGAACRPTVVPQRFGFWDGPAGNSYNISGAPGDNLGSAGW